MISRFPGQVVISPTDPCPTSLYQPSKADLEEIRGQLDSLRAELRKLTTVDHNVLH